MFVGVRHSGCTCHEEIAMANVRTEENAVIHQVGGRALSVDIFRPANQPGR
jgi:hypothetical protein